MTRKLADRRMEPKVALVVFVHGALCDARFWQPQINAIAGAGIDAVALPLEGFYPDRFDSCRFSATRHVASICAFLRQCDRPVHLVGHSRGGRLALAAAARLPHRIDSLVLVEPGGISEPDFLPCPHKAHSETAAKTLQLLAQNQEAALQHYVDSGHGAGAWVRAPEAFKALARDNAITLSGTLPDITQPLGRETSKLITAPTLLIEGTDSPPLFSAIASVLEETIALTSRLQIVNADHFLTMTAARKFNDVLRDFVSAHNGAY